MEQGIFTSESVTSGHLDKLCEAISDVIVDACLVLDKNTRVAVKTCVKVMKNKSVIILTGEVSLDAPALDYDTIACQAAANIGYDSNEIGMDATNPDL